MQASVIRGSLLMWKKEAEDRFGAASLLASQKEEGARSQGMLAALEAG